MVTWQQEQLVSLILTHIEVGCYGALSLLVAVATMGLRLHFVIAQITFSRSPFLQVMHEYHPPPHPDSMLIFICLFLLETLICSFERYFHPIAFLKYLIFIRDKYKYWFERNTDAKTWQILYSEHF